MKVDPRYQISSTELGVQRVRWIGPLRSNKPANDAENLALAMDRHWHDPSSRHKILFDLVDCHDVDACGIVLLMLLRRHLAHPPVTWRIDGAPKSFRRMLSLLNLDSIFQTPDDLTVRHSLVLLSDLPVAEDLETDDVTARQRLSQVKAAVEELRDGVPPSEVATGIEIAQLAGALNGSSPSNPELP